MRERPAPAAILGVDVGGTFTDAVLIRDGRVFAGKAASTPADQSEGALAAAAQVLEQADMDGSGVLLFAHGMTVATNALLEGDVADAAFEQVRACVRACVPALRTKKKKGFRSVGNLLVWGFG